MQKAFLQYVVTIWTFKLFWQRWPLPCQLSLLYPSSCFQYINYLNTLFTWAFFTLLASLRCGKAYGSSKLWFWWNVVTLFNICIGIVLYPAWAIMCIFKLCPLENDSEHISHEESLSSVNSDHVNLQTFPTRKLLHNICICQHFFQKLGFHPAWATCASSSYFHKKTF